MRKLHPTRKEYFDKKNGYWMVWLSDKTRTQKHRFLMEHHLGRLLEFNEVVHHKNGDKTDNNLSNLEIKLRSKHSSDHNKLPKKEVYETRKCAYCGQSFDVNKRYIRYKKRKTPLIYCSHSCGAKAQWERKRNAE